MGYNCHFEPIIDSFIFPAQLLFSFRVMTDDY
jgi:hypothetical protein